MPKEQREICLVGKNSSYEEARLGSEVTHFRNDDKQVTVGDITDTLAIMITKKGKYRLTKHKSLNIYQGTCKGIKTQFIPKKIVAKILYWA